METDLITSFKKLNVDKLNGLTLYREAEAKRQIGDLIGALEDLNTLNELEPNNASTLSLLADTERRLGDYEAALKHFKKADKLMPNDAFILRYRGETKRMLSNLKGALIDFIRADELEPNNAFTLSRRGDVRRMLGCFEEALEDLTRADQLKPDDTFTIKSRGETKRKLGYLKGALEDFDKAAELAPKNWWTFYTRGRIKAELNDYVGAICDFSQAEELNPRSELVHTAQAEAKQKLLENMTAAVIDMDEDVDQLRISAAEKMSNFDFKSALFDLNVAISIAPDSASLLNQRGEAKRQLGLFQEALVDLNRANQLEPNDKLTILRCALVHLALGMTHQAFIKFSQYDELVPYNADYLSEKNQAEDELLKGVPSKDIEVIKLLGRGVWGEVHLAKLNGKQVALKTPLGSGNNIFGEAMTTMKLWHKNIVQPLGFCYGESGEISLLMEYAEDGSLNNMLYNQRLKLKRDLIISFACDIAAGLSYLHGRNVIHRDLKSANILLFQGGTVAKIADFGQSRFLFLNDESAKSIVGTPFFMAPEVLAENPYNASADIYSFGVLLYEMCTNTTLPIVDEKVRMNKISTGVMDADLRKLIMKCCLADPLRRPTIAECLAILNKM